MKHGPSTMTPRTALFLRKDSLDILDLTPWHTTCHTTSRASRAFTANIQHPFNGAGAFHPTIKHVM